MVWTGNAGRGGRGASTRLGAESAPALPVVFEVCCFLKVSWGVLVVHRCPARGRGCPAGWARRVAASGLASRGEGGRCRREERVAASHTPLIRRVSSQTREAIDRASVEARSARGWAAAGRWVPRGGRPPRTGNELPWRTGAVWPWRFSMTHSAKHAERWLLGLSCRLIKL